MVHEVRESHQAFEAYGPVLMPVLQKAGTDLARQMSCPFTA